MEAAGSSIYFDCSPYTHTSQALEGGLVSRVNMPANGKSPQRFPALVPGQPGGSFEVSKRHLLFPFFSFFNFLDKIFLL